MTVREGVREGYVWHYLGIAGFANKGQHGQHGQHGYNTSPDSQWDIRPNNPITDIGNTLEPTRDTGRWRKVYQSWSQFQPICHLRACGPKDHLLWLGGFDTRKQAWGGGVSSNKDPSLLLQLRYIYIVLCVQIPSCLGSFYISSTTARTYKQVRILQPSASWSA